ncbi:MAG: potassium channel protein [Candidatus Hydrogenedentota bacterium]|nr:MAG: potassium channel protein [Candidatus Hydrogenedentota bacterium]
MPDRPEKRLLIAVTSLMLTIVIGTVMYRLLTENRYDWVSCLYMTVITLATVGYGEVIETSQFPAARIFTIVLILFGMGILLYSVSTATSIMVDMDLRDVFKRRKMNKDIKDLRNHFILCGAGATGSCIAQELIKTATRFVVVERDPERIEAVRKLGEVFHIKADATDDSVLVRAGIAHASGLAAALSTEKDNLFLTLTARQLNPSIRIVARGLDESVNRKIHKAGADAVVSPTFIGGLRMASELIRPSVVSFLDTMLRDASGTIRFEELPITPKSKFINQTIKATRIRDDSNLLIVALRRPDSPRFTYNPPADTLLTDGMTLVVLGESTQIQELRKLSGSTV